MSRCSDFENKMSSCFHQIVTFAIGCHDFENKMSSCFHQIVTFAIGCHVFDFLWEVEKPVFPDVPKCRFWPKKWFLSWIDPVFLYPRYTVSQSGSFYWFCKKPLLTDLYCIVPGARIDKLHKPDQVPGKVIIDIFSPIFTVKISGGQFLVVSQLKNRGKKPNITTFPVFSTCFSTEKPVF